jgi:hypothetical protein
MRLHANVTITFYMQSEKEIMQGDFCVFVYIDNNVSCYELRHMSFIKQVIHIYTSNAQVKEEKVLVILLKRVHGGKLQ